MLVIDKRSLLNSSLFSAAERNVRHCIIVRQNISKSWGGFPVVLIFGDDYQSYPVEKYGVIEGYTRRMKFKIENSMSKTLVVQLLVNKGGELFMNHMTQHIFHLPKNYRVKDEKFRACWAIYEWVQSMRVMQ